MGKPSKQVYMDLTRNIGAGAHRGMANTSERSESGANSVNRPTSSYIGYNETLTRLLHSPKTRLSTAYTTRYAMIDDATNERVILQFLNTADRATMKLEHYIYRPKPSTKNA